MFKQPCPKARKNLRAQVFQYPYSCARKERRIPVFQQPCLCAGTSEYRYSNSYVLAQEKASEYRSSSHVLAPGMTSEYRYSSNHVLVQRGLRQEGLLAPGRTSQCPCAMKDIRVNIFQKPYPCARKDLRVQVF